MNSFPPSYQINAELGLKPISASMMTHLRQVEFSKCKIKSRGDMFARCGVCDNKRSLRNLHPVGSTNYTIFKKAYKMHLAEQEAHHNAHYGSQYMSIFKPEKCLIIIHDKMDHAKRALPCFASKTKSIDSFTWLPIAMIGMIVHGHGDVKFAHFSLDLYPGDCNHTIGLVAKLLRDLEKLSASSLGVLFKNSGSTPLFDVVLKRKEVCIDSLDTSQPSIPMRTLPPILHVQLDIVGKITKVDTCFASSPC